MNEWTRIMWVEEEEVDQVPGQYWNVYYRPKK